ncbi:MAG TPA: LamG-like jellyroll fold domain-containing protein [Tepidisphaeraceae bacterium]|nr:LamG-like jellyroll fold domain-containing protein [Tepidisphaeraceae bacterium]
MAQQTRFSWQQPHATVKATGDLEWAPQPFEYNAGESVRYIDFDAGDDANAGTKEQPWKHHPWDGNATGNAKAASGVNTYVFKGGVTYRGTLTADDSGQPDNPIRLTRDPGWGDGPPVLAGSRAVTGGWTRATADTAGDIPDPTKVWYQEVGKDVTPYGVWLVAAGDKITRLHLARDPNWTVSDPEDVKSEWYTWKNSTTEETTDAEGKKESRAWAIDPDRLKDKDPDAFKGGTIWTEYVSVMGQPYPALIEAYDPEKSAIKVGGPWGDAANYKPIWMNRYYLENLPRFLDTPGEYWFDQQAGRLFVRLPGDADPNAARLELADRTTQIDIRNQSHIHISGLAFRFGNVVATHERWWAMPEIDPAGVKILGNCNDITVANCSFEHVPQPIWAKAIGEGDTLDNLNVTDNDIAHTDYGGIEITSGGGREKPTGVLNRVNVLRNRMFETGMRPRRAAQGHTLTVEFARVGEIAGNILHRTGGAGLFIFGGKGGGATFDVPLSRVLVHHNKVTDSLLWTNDYGGIETWQGGTFYVYNNISGNPNGYWHFGHQGSKDKPKEEINHASARFGFAFYFDGSFKNYVFNNIAWGKSNELGHPHAATTAFHEVIGFLNTFANNTAYRFVASVRRQAPQGGRGAYIGNVFDDATEVFFRHADIDKPQDVNMERATADPDAAASTLAYSNNVFFGKPRFFGYFDKANVHRTLEGFRSALENAGAVASQTGWTTDDQPLMDPANFDFRPADGSVAIDKGVKIFAPWALSRTVGEWHFRRHNADPSVILGDHWFMTADYTDRETYRKLPRNDLKGVNLTADSYVEGPLEDWVSGALKLNGTDQHATLPSDTATSPGQSLDVGNDSFVVEAYVRAAANSDAATLVAKRQPNAVGYEVSLAAGLVNVTLRGTGDASADITGTRNVSDGQWHHVLVEVDRSAGVMRLYCDGQKDGEAKFDTAEVGSIDNPADFVVGRGFAGEIEYVRVAKGTLAEAHTTIDELYTWQFDGPFLRDFTGRQPTAKRDAGALER